MGSITSSFVQALIDKIRLLWLTIQYGEDMRNWCDIGFSTVETT